MRPATLIILLGIARAIAALVNIVHDCDEVFNYWEPLHYLVHGTGMQTWEYSSKYALRPYLYLLLHWPAAKAFSMVLGSGSSKLWAFYGTRAFLSLACWFLEGRLIRAVHRTCGTVASTNMTVLLATCAGTFFAPSTLLPSTFAMMCMTSAATATLLGNTTELIVAAVLGVMLGWPVAGVAFLPLALFVLSSPRLGRSFALLTMLCVTLLLAVAATDQYFYGRATISLVNFIQYNVVGGGESSLYGVEAWPFYFINGVLNFGIALPAALIFAPVALMGAMNLTSTRITRRTLWAMSPLYLWLAAITALPHKEERFLYVVYPQICLGAGVTLSVIPRVATDLAQAVSAKVKTAGELRGSVTKATGLAVLLAMLASTAFSVSRICGMLINYSAPMHTWAQIPKAANVMMTERSGPASSDHGGEGHPYIACVGAEWHRFPSSFFLPKGVELAFYDSGFDGLLPKAFDQNSLGTHAAPEELNDRNEADSRLVLGTAENCDFWVGTGDEGPDLDPAIWRLWSHTSFVHHSHSPFPYRSFWIPGSHERNKVVEYQLFMRTSRASCTDSYKH